MARADILLGALILAGLIAWIPHAGATEMPAFPGLTGDASRGRALVADRRKSFCLLCHSGPFPEERFMGNLAPPLDGAGARWSADALRYRLVDSRKLNPETIMPAYYQTEGVDRVARAFEGKTILTAQEIEDIVAFLTSLRD